MPDKPLTPLIAQVQRDEEAKRKYLADLEAETRDCECCGQPFRVTRAWQKFCSPNCRSRQFGWIKRTAKVREAELVAEVARLKSVLQASSNMTHSGDVGQSDRGNAQ